MNDIHVEDLKHPVLTDIQKQAIASAPSLTMSVQAVLKDAMARTGLSGFGPDDFKERLAIWLQSVDEDPGLGALGRSLAYEQMVNSAARRLRVEDLIARHPEILDVEIDRPLIIAGLPRSGTTHLVNSLATNPDLRSMPIWESYEPVPLAAEMSFEETLDNPRYKRAAQGWEMMVALLPYWHAMHDMSPSHIHEDCELQCIDFSSYFLEWMSRVPRWQEYYFRHDQTPHYAYGKKVQQAMTWLKGPNRWVMKSPHHMENFVPLHKVYPGATILITHRDPIAVVQSSATLMAYFDRVRRTELDMPGLIEYWTSRIERMLRKCVEERDSLPSGQVMDIYFHDYMADQRGMLEKVYSLAGLPMTETASVNIDNYLAGNPRGKLGRIVFDLIGDFEVDIKAMRERFQFYYDRFPVKVEPVIGEPL